VNTLTGTDLNLLGAVTAMIEYALLCVVFAARMKGASQVEYWAGLAFIATALPLVYLLISATGKNGLYYIQLSLMLLFILSELLLDYIFQINFREMHFVVIVYVTLFFAAMGGMIGVAAHAGKLWMYLSVVGFFSASALAIVQHIVTGK